MSAEIIRIVQELVAEEIRRVVAEAVQTRDCLPTGKFAAAIARAYPNCGMTPDELADEILRSAIKAGVTVEISRPAGCGAAGALPA